MGSQLWLLTDRQILDDYPQKRILEALKLRCKEQEVGLALVLIDQIALTVIDGRLGLQINQKIVTAYPQVILVRLPTPTVQSDNAITVLRHLEKLGCRLVNHPKAILNCVNKFWTLQELAGHGVPLPDTFSYVPSMYQSVIDFTSQRMISSSLKTLMENQLPGGVGFFGGHDDFSKMIQAAEPLGYPVVVKSTRGYQGKAEFLARDKHHLLDVSHLLRHDAPYLFQKFVKEPRGKDVRVVIVGGRVIGSIICCSTDGRMQSNCCLGGAGVSCALSEPGKLLATQVSAVLGADVCGIDLLLQDNGSFVVGDADANVSLTEFDQACKLDLGSIIADYALSLLPGKPSKEMPPLSAASRAKEIDGTKEQESSAGDLSNVSNIDESEDTPKVPKPCSPALPECAYNTDK